MEGKTRIMDVRQQNKFEETNSTSILHGFRFFKGNIII